MDYRSDIHRIVYGGHMERERKEKLMDMSDMIDNLYKHGRQISFMENRERYYGSDVLLFPNEAYTLKAIAQNEGINQMELSEKMFRTKGATSVVVRKLIKKGLVDSRTGENDQRVHCLYPTEKGREVYRKHLEYDLEYISWLSERLEISEDELIVFNRVLRLMMKDFQERRVEDGSWPT